MGDASNRELEQGEREVREPIAIMVANDGRLSADGKPVQLADLESSLRDAMTSDRDVSIVLSFDDGVQYGQAIEVLDLLDHLDFEKGSIRVEGWSGGSEWEQLLLERNDEGLDALSAASGRAA